MAKTFSIGRRPPCKRMIDATPYCPCCGDPWEDAVEDEVCDTCVAANCEDEDD